MAAVLRPERYPPVPAPKPPAAHADAIRVMIVDDSLTVRTVFSRMIDREHDLAVVADADTAEKALLTLRSTDVDVILLDLEMPGMGGIEALPRILQRAGKAQVLVVSSLTQDGAEHTLTALSMGAADTMLKPRPGGFNDEYRDALLAKVRALGGQAQEGDSGSAPSTPALPPRRRTKAPRVVAIGASTGGIHALNLFLRRLPRAFDLPILITQHLPETFIPVFARQVQVAAGREAVIADEGTGIEHGRIVIAPGYGHLVARRAHPGLVSATGVVTGLARDPAPSGCMPSVDPMFESLAECFDGHVAAVLLSGMGRDGTEGAGAVARAGGAVFAQDEESCAVWGMPRGVTESGVATTVLPPEELADAVVTASGLVASGVTAWP
jgi:two-component system, chemotaxis family, protein-glutamate methylesterase/glutaminase